MNDKDWNDNEDFWDDEAENDDDDYNDFGNENIDANNDDTFANTSEWNEDEHEEMIARDSILSHTIHRNNTNRNSCVNRNNNPNNQHHNSHDSQHRTHNGSNSVQTTSDLDTLLRALGSQNNGNIQATSASSTWIPAQDDIIPSDLVASILGMAGPSDGPDLDAWTSSSSKNFPIENQGLNRSLVADNIGPPKAPSAWQQPFEGVDRIRQAQLQRQQLQLQLILQAQMQEQEQLIRSMQLREESELQRRLASQNQLRQIQIRQEQQMRQQQQQHQVMYQQAASINLLRSMQRDGAPLKVLTVDELEKQLVKTNNQSLPQQSHSMSNDMRHQPIGSPAQTQHSQQGRTAGGPFDAANPKILTVDELEKQLVRTSICQPQQQIQPQPHDIKRHTTGPQKEHQNQHRRAVWNRVEPDKSDAWSHSDNHSGRRENRRDYFRHHHKRETTIIPPQVQLQVIDRIKSSHPSKSMQPDEFLADRMPDLEGTIQSKKHSLNSSLKEKHDGILTEQERNWLTKVQKKIQADCDENLDQDYYYLLYFNRSSMTNEAANKPSGPSVLDKRFIPRERLLYNNSAL